MGYEHAYRNKSRWGYLHYIVPIENLPSIEQFGILSHNRISQLRLRHADVSMLDVQVRRNRKAVTSAGVMRPLHDFVNLYFGADNPMMVYLMHQQRDAVHKLCVLCVNYSIMDCSGVMVSDMNSSRDAARFYDAGQGLRHLPFDHIFAYGWKDDDEDAEDLRKGAKCAEVLVPEVVPYSYIEHALAYDRVAAQLVEDSCPTLACRIDGQVYIGANG